ncbi:MAG TPA: LTA synthase family protein [Dokdonella sp.]|uniref:LTA synthase family protein n=1 Tax=Dokdonella sp. TaxID=2291710 RepID=UPI002D800EEE|nr:LTA synthase family protein [Dokdonella sp.]HET9033172.1 LTA synthase family protein [Dokdonella sp.]
MSDALVSDVSSAETRPRWGQYRHLLLLWLIFLATSLITRIVLAAISVHVGQMSLIELPYAFGAGLLLDALAGLYLCLPFALWIWLMPARWYSSRIGRVIIHLVFAVAVFGFLYLIAAEYFFFEEFNSRFNYTAVEYLIYPTEVIGNIRDSYPVDTVLSLCALGALLITFLLRGPISDGFVRTIRFGRRSLIMLVLVLATVVSVWAISLESVHSLSSNRVADEVASNGVYSFFSAFRNARIDYERYYITLPEKEAIARVRKLIGQSNTRWLAAPDAPGNPLARHVDNSDLGPPRKLNVIFLFEESMGAEFVGSLGGKGYTPNIDRIAAQSLSFTHLYASGTRTVRGMEALTTSLAPVPPESVIKRTGNKNLFNLSTIMRKQGYSPSFIYGGYGTFDDMNAYYRANGWRVLDRTDMPSPKFATIWGISDEELFDNALADFDKQIARGEPIFSLVMSTSNHRPYLFPEGIPGVKPKGGGREAGVRYADYAIGKFFDQLQKKPWYKDTVLVIAGDHGARVYGRAKIPVSNYTIPFIVHAPAIIAPQRVDTLSSQVDIGPTVLGLLRLNYESWLPGRDILRMGPDDGYAIFNHDRDIAMMRHGELATLGFRKTVTTERYDLQRDELTPAPANVELERDTEALFQLSWEMFADGRQREK